MATAIQLRPVYPRGYGEHEEVIKLCSKLNGLSPWIRGAQVNFIKQPGGMRFIPVDTGSTAESILANFLTSVYPRGYGEHARMFLGIASQNGLSPWIRGAHKECYSPFWRWRFIPVDTGSTKSHFFLRVIETVYPRGYGEHPIKSILLFRVIGLSPWIRGAQKNGQNLSWMRRFIPVDTGSTYTQS